MTSVDSGVETENDSNDSMIVPPAAVADPEDYVNGDLPESNDEPVDALVVDAAPEPPPIAPDEVPLIDPGQFEVYWQSLSEAGWMVCNPVAAHERQVFHARHIHKMKSSIKLQSRSHRFENLQPLRNRETKEVRLFKAASTNNTEQVLCLLEEGVNPNCYDHLKRHPLHFAACRGYSEVIKLLLQFGANPNAKDTMGNTPLHLAACTNHVLVVTQLLKAGTDIESLDCFGRNPIQLAKTRLQLLQRNSANNPDAILVKSEVKNVIEMMLECLNRLNRQETDARELLNSFSSRLTLTQTPQEVDFEIQSLLSSLSTLSIEQQQQQQQQPMPSTSKQTFPSSSSAAFS